MMSKSIFLKKAKFNPETEKSTMQREKISKMDEKISMIEERFYKKIKNFVNTPTTTSLHRIWEPTHPRVRHHIAVSLQQPDSGH